MTKFGFIPAVILFIFFSCCTSKQITNEELNRRFGTSYQYIFSSENTYVLSIKKPDTSNSLVLFVLEVQTDSVVYKAAYPGGTAAWLNDTQLEINILPGNITGDEKETDLHYIYDVKEHKKITIKQQEAK